MGGDQFGEFVCGENLGLKGLIIQYFKLFTCVGQNWVSASLTGLPISNFSYFALLRSISSHFSLISVLTVTADVHVEHSAATNDFNRSVEQKKIDGRMSFFYIYMVWQSTSDQSWKNQKFPFLLTQLMTPLLMI